MPQVASKIAHVTMSFWIMKVLATTLGETAGDYISMTLGWGYYAGLAITFAALAVVIACQLSARTYRPLLFWTAIIATTTAGTEVSDFMDRSLGLGYLAGSVLLTAALVSALALWYLRTGSLAVDPITSRDVEAYFWLAVLASNSLGTAFGDYLVDGVGLSFIQGALVTAAIIGIVLVLHRFSKLNEVLLFWIAFVFTRPFGATFGDLLTKPLGDGGLNLPRGHASLVTIGMMLAVLLVSTYWSKTQEDELST